MTPQRKKALETLEKIIDSDFDLADFHNMDFIEAALIEEREKAIRECADIANNGMDRDGELTQREGYCMAEWIRNKILSLLSNEEKK